MRSDPYPYLNQSMVCLLGDSGHPVRVILSPKNLEANNSTDDASPESGGLYGYRGCRSSWYSFQQEVFPW